MVFQIYAFLCFAIFVKNSKIQNGETKFFFKLRWLLCRDTLRFKNLSKSLYLARFSRYKHFCVLQFLRKIRKFKMAAILAKINFFLKIGMAILQRYPVGQKFRPNRSI